MTRALQIVGTCDVCGKHADVMDTFGVGDVVREIDLCGSCYDGVQLSDLLDLLTVSGRPVATPQTQQKTKGTYPRSERCPICNKMFAPQGISRHIRFHKERPAQ